MDINRIIALVSLLLGIFCFGLGLVACILCTLAAQTAFEYDSLASFDVQDMHDLATIGLVCSWLSFVAAAIGGMNVTLAAIMLRRK